MLASGTSYRWQPHLWRHGEMQNLLGQVRSFLRITSVFSDVDEWRLGVAQLSNVVGGGWGAGAPPNVGGWNAGFMDQDDVDDVDEDVQTPVLGSDD